MRSEIRPVELPEGVSIVKAVYNNLTRKVYAMSSNKELLYSLEGDAFRRLETGIGPEVIDVFVIGGETIFLTRDGSLVLINPPRKGPIVELVEQFNRAIYTTSATGANIRSIEVIENEILAILDNNLIWVKNAGSFLPKDQPRRVAETLSGDALGLKNTLIIQGNKIPIGKQSLEAKKIIRINDKTLMLTFKNSSKVVVTRSFWDTDARAVNASKHIADTKTSNGTKVYLLTDDGKLSRTVDFHGEDKTTKGQIEHYELISSKVSNVGVTNGLLFVGKETGNLEIHTDNGTPSVTLALPDSIAGILTTSRNYIRTGYDKLGYLKVSTIILMKDSAAIIDTIVP